MRTVARLLVFIAVAFVTPVVRTVHAVEEAPSIRLVLLVAVDQCRYDYPMEPRPLSKRQGSLEGQGEGNYDQESNN